MSGPFALSERLSRAFETPTQGVVGLVDELLAASREQDIHLGWNAGQCQVVVPTADPPERIEVPVQKSIVRAILARLAALCNERLPDSVSPYRGAGEVGVDPFNVIRVRFVNTPDEQSLELSLARSNSLPAAEGQPPERAVPPVRTASR